MSVLVFLLIPVMSILLILLASKSQTQTIAIVSSAISVTSVAFAIAQYFLGNNIIPVDTAWIASLGVRFHLAADGVSLLMILITNVVSMVSMYITLSENKFGEKQFYILILAMQVFMIGVFTAQDLFLYYIFWELSLIPAYFLLLIWGKAPNLRMTTLRFFLFTLFGSLLMLIAIIYLGNQGETSDFSLLTLKSLQMSELHQGLLFFAFIIAFAIKTPIFPLHGWQADTYTAAPTSVTVILSGIMSKMALYSVFRFVIPLFPKAVTLYGSYIAILASFGVLYASLVALRQTHIKRMFAYVSMAHVGIIFAGLFVFYRDGLNGTMIQMVAHAINTCGLFLIVHILFLSKGTDEIASFGGLREKMPKFSAVFLIILFGSIGVPFTNGFVGEFLILTSLFQYNLTASILAGSGVILGAVYMLNLYKNVVLGPTTVNQNTEDIQNTNLFLMYSIAFVVIITGLFPNWIAQLSFSAVHSILPTNFPN